MLRYLLFAASVSSFVAEAAPLLTAHQCARPPIVDGNLDDPCWDRATVCTPFLSAQDNSLALEQTRFRVCWDRETLYIGIEATESLLDPKLNMLHLVKANATGADASVFADDCIECFLVRPDGQYFHFAANTGDGTYEGRGRDPSWNGRWRSAVTRGESSYVVEIAVPFASMDGHPSGEWGLNVTRSRSQGRRHSTWSGLTGAFHQPELFGRLRFAPGGPALRATSISVTPRGCLVSASTHNGTGVLKLHIRADSTTGQTETIPLPADGRLVPLAQGLRERSLLTVRYQLSHDGTVVATSAALPFRLASAVVTLKTQLADAEARLWLNGAAITYTTDTALELRDGPNTLALAASRTGPEPRLTARVLSEGRTIPNAWAARTDSGDDNWQTQMPRLEDGWQTVRTAQRLWPIANAAEIRMVTVLYVGARRHTFFPKLDTFRIPSGSRQLMRLYLSTPTDIPLNDYTVFLDLPPSLSFVAYDAADPQSGPEVTRAPLPQEGGGRQDRLTLRYPVLPGSGMELSIRWADSTNHTTAYAPAIAAGGTLDWRHFATTLIPSPGTATAHPLIIKWQKRGVSGTFWVDNVVFREKGSTENLLKMGTFDEPTWRNGYIKPEGKDGSRCVKIVASPTATDRQQAVWVDPEEVVPVDPGKEYVIELDLRCENLVSPTSKPVAGILFEAPDNLPQGEYRIATSFTTMGGIVAEIPKTADMVVLPPLRNVRPQRARISPCYYGPRFQHPDVGKAYAENCFRSGITWTYGKIPNDVVPHIQSRGHRVFLSFGWEPWSAPSAMRGYLAEHPELQAVNFEGKPEKNHFCPTWMLREGDAVVDALETWMLTTLADSPYAGVNWDVEQPVVDPPTFCVCERCLRAFATSIGLPEERKVAAEELLDKHRDAWTHFRCVQNADMAGKLKQICRKASPPTEFSLYSGYQSKRTREHYGVDWGQMAPHLDFAIAGYGGSRTAVQATIDALDGVPFMGGEMWYVSDRSDDRPAPVVHTWANRLIRQFLESGGNGCLIWYLPTMEGGAFYATSLAAEFIAEHEAFLEDATRCDQRVTVTGLRPDHWFAFEKTNRTMVSLLSFSAEEAPVLVDCGGSRERATIGPYGNTVIWYGATEEDK